MQNTVIEEIPTDFNQESVTELSASLEKNKLFLLGEMHGVKENADIIYTLFKKFGFRQLDLEWDAKTKKVADIFLDTGEIDFEGIKDSPDGRITAGHFALLKKLREEGLLEKLVCFDIDFSLPYWQDLDRKSSWNKRDENMAQNILDSLSDSPTLVIAGNYHTQTESFAFEGEDKVSHPMGENVKNKIPEIPSGEIKYLSGKYHNYGAHSLINKAEDNDSKASFYKNEKGLYIFELPKATSAIIPNPDHRLEK